MKSTTKLAASIRSSDFQNRDFLMKHMKDPSLVDGYMKQNLYRARKLALILGSIMIISLLTVVYGFVQYNLTSQSRGEFFANNAQWNKCRDETEKQKSLATEATMIAEEVTLMAQEQLNECLKNK